MIKVIEVSSDSNIGGAGKCILTFLKTFDRSEFEVEAIVPTGSLLKPEIENLKVKVFETENLAEKSLDFNAIIRLRHMFKYLKPDVVHTHASMSARIAAWSMGIPVVYTRHSVFPQSKKLTSFPGKQINGFINNMTADRIIAVAEAAKDNLTETGIDVHKIKVILNGVEPLAPATAEQTGKLRMLYHIRPDEKVAVMAARLNEVKGHRYFIEAAARLKKEGIKAKFLIAGTGDMEESLKKQISDNNLEDYVIMMGFVKDVTPLMTLMDVQVNCSFGTEATSLALLEGMSLGKPAVVSEFGGNPGVITDGVNGFITPIHDVNTLTEKLRLLFTDDKLYGVMSENCRKVYSTKFTAEANTRAVEAVYKEAAAKRKNNKRKEREKNED